MRSLVVCSVLLSILTLAATIPLKNNTNTTIITLPCNNKQTYVEVLRGRDGRDGRDGVKGEKGDKGDKGETGPVGPAGPKSGGVVYTRWGRKSCPTGVELLYEGITGGGYYEHSGGGANYVCLPKDPEYLSTHVPPNYSLMYGTEYESADGIFPGKDQHNAPCAVCHASARSIKLMIPAKTSCPSSWTMEYKGYLMTERNARKNNKVYECVDENPESIDGSKTGTLAAHFYFIRTTCTGLPCPPYVNKRAITCVVCTK